MSQQSRHDAWRAGEAYELYMGRWSRQVAPRFLAWLNLPAQLRWLDLGCGTGALSAAILAQATPASLTGVDSSEGFLDQARAAITDGRARFLRGDARALPVQDDSQDVVVSALVLNFVPDRGEALAEMGRAARPGGTVGFYVWDYPGGGMELMSAFWKAAAALDPGVMDLREDRRFPFCTCEGLTSLATTGGLREVECTRIEIPTVFRDFEDYWHPFTLGAGPAPGYCMSLDSASRQRLKDALAASLPRAGDGSIPLKAACWAIRGLAS